MKHGKAHMRGSFLGPASHPLKAHFMLLRIPARATSSELLSITEEAIFPNLSHIANFGTQKTYSST